MHSVYLTRPHIIGKGKKALNRICPHLGSQDRRLCSVGLWGCGVGVCGLGLQLLRVQCLPAPARAVRGGCKGFGMEWFWFWFWFASTRTPELLAPRIGQSHSLGSI